MNVYIVNNLWAYYKFLTVSISASPYYAQLYFLLKLVSTDIRLATSSEEKQFSL